MDQADEVAKTFSRSGVRCKKVNGDTDPKNVTRTIRFNLGEKEDGGFGGIILIITHASIIPSWKIFQANRTPLFSSMSCLSVRPGSS